MDIKVKIFLEENDIKYRLHKHPAVFSVEESKKIIGNKIPGLRTKSLFLKSENLFCLITLPGEKRLDMKFLKNYFKTKDLKFASLEELEKLLKVRPGSVSPLCMLNASENINLIVDNEVYSSPIVVFHPNVNTESLEVSRKNFIKLYDSIKCRKEILDFPA